VFFNSLYDSLSIYIAKWKENKKNKKETTMKIINNEYLRLTILGLKDLLLSFRDESMWKGDEWDNLNKLMGHMDVLENTSLSDDDTISHLESCIVIFKQIRFTESFQTVIDVTIKDFEMMIECIKLHVNLQTVIDGTIKDFEMMIECIKLHANLQKVVTKSPATITF